MSRTSEQAPGAGRLKALDGLEDVRVFGGDLVGAFEVDV
jgi:hypothetical protein